MRHTYILFTTIFFLALYLGQPSSVFAQDSLETKPAIQSFIPALQSAVIPGWGQMSQKQWIRGGVYLAGEAFLLADAYYYWDSQYGRPGWENSARLFDREVAYGLVAWYGAGALLCAADAYYYSSHKRTTIPTVAALQSILFPGWGQLANSQHWKAAAMFLLQTSIGFAAYYQHQNYLYSQREGDDSRASFYKNDRNRLIWWSVGAMIFSAADAFVDCHLRDWDVSDDLSLSPIYFPDQKTVGVGITIPFTLRQP